MEEESKVSKVVDRIDDEGSHRHKELDSIIAIADPTFQLYIQSNLVANCFL